MLCVLEKLIMAEVSRHINVINKIYDVHSILYTVTNIYPKAWILPNTEMPNTEIKLTNKEM